jgi:hypothetical protein
MSVEPDSLNRLNSPSGDSVTVVVFDTTEMPGCGLSCDTFGGVSRFDGNSVRYDVAVAPTDVSCTSRA